MTTSVRHTVRARDILVARSRSRLFARDDSMDGSSGSSPSDYVRWVFVAVIVVVVVVILVTLYGYARRRKRMLNNFWSNSNAEPVENASQVGLFPLPRTHRRRRHSSTAHATADTDPVPTYHAAPGEEDLGVYDENGTYRAFEPPPYEPPKAALRPDYE